MKSYLSVRQVVERLNGLFDDNYLSALATIGIPGSFLDSVGEGKTEGGLADWSFALPHGFFLE